MITHTLTFFYSFIIKWFQDFISLILAPCQSKSIGQECFGVHEAAISPLLYCLPGCLQAGQGFGDNRTLLAEQQHLSDVINGPSRPWSRQGGCRHLCFSNPSFRSLPSPFSLTSSLPHFLPSFLSPVTDLSILYLLGAIHCCRSAGSLVPSRLATLHLK